MEPGYRRATLIPPWLLPTLLAILLVAGGFAAWSATRTRAALVRVPNVKGLDVPTARSRLVLSGFEVRTGDRRFSATVPKGAVLDQTPAPGELMPKGTRVVVAISNGSERFPMPDVTGEDVEKARTRLHALGLEVRVETVSSEATRGVVLSSYPAPSAQVATADIVQLTVSAGSATENILLPVNLQGKRFVLDPSATTSTTPLPTDITVQVARRLQSLLQASGAEVVMTRSSISTHAVSVEDRSMLALRANADAVIGIDVSNTGDGGMTVFILPSDQAAPRVYIGSVELSTAISKTMRAAGRRMRTLPATNDPVLLAGKTVGARVSLGSVSSKEDVGSFGDPGWADAIARDLYRGVGSAFASK